MKFTDIFKPLVFVFTHIDDAARAIPRIFKVAEDVQHIAPTAIDEATQLVASVGELAKASVKDSGTTLAAIEQFVNLAQKCVADKGLDLNEDKAAYAELLSIIQLIGNNNTWSDVATALKQTITNFDTFGATVQTALKQIEADVKGN